MSIDILSDELQTQGWTVEDLLESNSEEITELFETGSVELGFARNNDESVMVVLELKARHANDIEDRIAYGNATQDETNEDFVRRIMNFSKQGPLAQLMVIEALRFYSEMVMGTQPKDDKTSILNPLAWHECATDIYREWERKYGRK